MPMYEFKSAGKKSKAWWLRLIKQYGSKGGVNVFAKTGQVGWVEVNEVVAQLVQGGYVLATGKSTRKKYELTSFGHRYLAENPRELPEWQPPSTQTGAAQTGVNHKVPAGPGDVPIRSIVAAEEPTPVTPPPAEIVRPAEKPLSAPLNPTQTPVNTDFRAAFQAALTAVLLKKYGHLVTAAEVMEYLEGSNA